METLDGDHDTKHDHDVPPDGASILATHYCAAGNQPRMRATGSPDGRSLAFEFVDVSGEAGREVMRGLVVTFVDADHFAQAWTSRAADGKEHSSVFAYTRVKRSRRTRAWSLPRTGGERLRVRPRPGGQGPSA